ncbi:MAG: GNAT family N-acetyltransferase [Hyphomicrobiaceae bacterium]
MSHKDRLAVRIAPAIREVPAAAWDALANPASAPFDPFLAHGFLAALEQAGTVAESTGWAPRHVLLQDGAGNLLGCMPCYLKRHSQGEYVFDHGWADAYQRAGGRYYPKLQAAVPFTPVPGRRLLTGAAAGNRATLLATGAVEYARTLGVSSLHIAFLPEADWRGLAQLGFLQRLDRQFHWTNRGYRSFDDFLAALSSRKRKTVRKERADVRSAGLTIEWVRGRDIAEAHWDTFFAFYMDTGSRKWGRPYLNRRFFSLLGQAMAERCLLVMAKRAGRPVAGALNLIGGDCLYGRYWGAVEHHPCLHFEVCYYQAIEFAIANGLPRVEAGAQGEHKLARGYLPAATYSAHWIADAGFRRAVARYLDEERVQVSEHGQALAALGPYRKGDDTR